MCAGPNLSTTQVTSLDREKSVLVLEQDGRVKAKISILYLSAFFSL